MTTALIRPGQLYAWRGPSFVITNERGACDEDEPLSGYYFRETRHLHRLQLRLNGEQPWLCEAALTDPHHLSFEYVYPELRTTSGGGSGEAGDEEHADARGIPYRSIAISLEYAPTIDGLSVVVVLRNHARRSIEIELDWILAADFADLLEAQGNDREQNAAVACEAGHGVLRLAYAHERLPIGTLVHFDADEEWRVTPCGASRRMTLAPHQRTRLALRVSPYDSDSPLDSREVGRREHTFERWRQGFTRIAVPGNLFAESIIAANVRDVGSFPLLDGRQDEWLALQAGMPLYPAFFGRDALTAGWQAAFLDRGASLDAALSRLGRLQTDRDDAWRDEEPGRIPYQVRRGPLARLDLNPYSAYYADFASPLMFVISVAHLFSWTGERAHLEKHWDTMRRILDWARTRGDRDGDGYLEYQTRSPKGAKNQGWKDSGDAVVYDDGTPVPPPIATCELQGYWFAAQQLMAIMSLIVGQRGDAREHWRNATDLKSRFNRDWWIPETSCVALAMDARKQLAGAVTSNAGHCIAAGIVDGEHLPGLVQRLFAPDMFSGWGVRTLSTAHAAYDPLSYHRGSVWPVEQATIAFGLRRFGYNDAARELTRAMFDLASLYPEYRIPECVGGTARTERSTPGAYPRANTPQLWNASAFPLLIHTMLGFQPVALLETLVVDPDLPAWMPEVVIEDLRIAGATVSLRFWRSDTGKCHAEILRRTGTCRLLVQPPPESTTATARDRFTGILETLMH